jgi:hypothetical protein
MSHCGSSFYPFSAATSKNTITWLIRGDKKKDIWGESPRGKKSRSTILRTVEVHEDFSREYSLYEIF